MHRISRIKIVDSAATVYCSAGGDRSLVSPVGVPACPYTNGKKEPIQMRIAASQERKVRLITVRPEGCVVAS